MGVSASASEIRNPVLASNPNKVAYVRARSRSPVTGRSCAAASTNARDLRVGIDVRHETTVHGTEEARRSNLRPGIELGAVLHERPERLEPAGPRQSGAPPRALRPAHRHGDGERTPMARLIGEPGERAQLPSVDPQVESHGSPGGEVRVDQRLHRGRGAHDTPPGHGAATVANCGRSIFV